MTPYYDEDGITIYHGDCLDVLPTLGPADLIATDPPYGIGVNYGGSFDDKRADYWSWLTARITASRAVAPVMAFTHRVAALSHLDGWDWVAVWNKPMSCGVRVGNSPVLPHWEPIFLYGIHSLGTSGSSFMPDVITLNPERAPTGGKRGVKGGGWPGASAADHPTPKPLSLYVRLVDALCPAGGLVVDPFMGSGTTLRAAKDTGRRAIGIEIEERHCEQAAKRLAQGVMDFGGAA